MSKPPITFVAPLAHADIQALVTGDITRNAHQALLLRINERFSYVFETMMTMMGRSFDWYDYDNEGGENHPGFFDADSYAEDINLVGDFQTPHHCLYPQSFPTRWLWEEFEEALRVKLIEHTTRLAKQASEAAAAIHKQDARKKEIIAGIRSKLTSEELKLVSFK